MSSIKFSFSQTDLLRLPSVLDLHMQPILSPSKECTTTKFTTLTVSSFCLASHQRPRLIVCSSMVCCHVDAAHWFLDRWDLTALLGPTSIHDLASQPCQLCSVQYSAFAAICRYWNPRRYQSREVFPLRLHWVLLLV
jgi:hypothetical protein